MQLTTLRVPLASAALFALLALPAFADQVKYSADLTPGAETPATDSTGKGSLDATLDTESRVFTWTITYSGLTGDATAAHFHGPAAPGEKAPPVVPIDGALTSPINGNVTLTEDQLNQLKDSKWYFNVHTAKYPDGEIRGQVVPAAGL